MGCSPQGLGREMGTVWDLLSHFWDKLAGRPMWDVPAPPVPQGQSLLQPLAGDTNPVTLGPKAAIWDRFFYTALANFWHSVFSACPREAGFVGSLVRAPGSREGPVVFRAFMLCRLHLGF